MLFGKFNHERILHKQLIDLSTSPVRCKHFTFGNPKKVIFDSTSDYLRYLTRKQTVTHLAFTFMTSHDW